MSTISAGTTSTNALVNTGDTTGNLVFQTNGTTTAMTIDTSGNVNISRTGARITGDFSNATIANRVAFQTSTVNGNTAVIALPNGTSAVSAFRAFNNSDPTNASFIDIAAVGGIDARVSSGITGTGTYLPMTFYTNGSEQMRIDTSGNVGIGTSSPARRLDVSASSSAGSADIGITNTQSSTLATVATTGTTYSFSGVGGSTSWFYGSKTVALGTDSANPIQFITNAGEKARIDSSGNLLVGQSSWSWSSNGTQIAASGRIFNTSSTDYNMELAGAQSGRLRFYTSGGGSATTVGSITVTTSATAYNTSSDYRLKDNPQPLTGSGAFIDALKPKTWQWKTDGSRGVGFIAHEVQEVSPSSVVGEKDGEQMQAMEYGSAEFVANIVAELQSLRARVAALEGAK